jgi:hypothetical protein
MGQDAPPSKQAPGDLEFAVIREFQDLANAKQISGKLQWFDLRKRAIKVTVEHEKEPQRFILDPKVSVWGKLPIKSEDGKPIKDDDGKPATKQLAIHVSRLKEWAAGNPRYLGESKGKVIRIVIDKTGEPD